MCPERTRISADSQVDTNVVDVQTKPTQAYMLPEPVTTCESATQANTPVMFPGRSRITADGRVDRRVVDTRGEECRTGWSPDHLTQNHETSS